MEHHHYDQCLMILNSQGTNILSSLNRSQYSKLCQLLKHAIISTDLAIYFQLVVVGAGLKEVWEAPDEVWEGSEEEWEGPNEIGEGPNEV